MSQDLEVGQTHPRPRFEHQEFVPARSLLGLTSGLAPVDSLLGGLKPGSVVLLTGSRIRLHAAERYCVRAQLPVARGGLGGGAYFIDGGNSFDVYLFTELARRHRLDYDAALNRQLLSRAFTVYELRSLIEDSAAFFETKKPKLLIVSEVLSLFTEDVERTEAARIVSGIADRISEFSRTEHAPVLMTSAARPQELTPLLEERCAISAEVVEGGGWLRSRLYKHPSKGPFELRSETVPRSFNQATLEATHYG